MDERSASTGPLAGTPGLAQPNTTEPHELANQSRSQIAHEAVDLPTPAKNPQPRAKIAEVAAVVALVTAFDITLFRGAGFSGWAAFYAITLPVLLFGAPQRHRSTALLVTGLMVLALAARLVWSGGVGTVALGIPLVVAFALCIAGRTPYVWDIFANTIVTPIAGILGLAGFKPDLQRWRFLGPRSRWLTVGLPAVVVFGFGTLFVLANPDVADAFHDKLLWLSNEIEALFAGDLITGREVVTWIVVGLFAIGLLRPMARLAANVLEQGGAAQSDTQALIEHSTDPRVLYATCRNTLLAVIVLFAAYLVFEFQTLWFREFPEGFYYGGYAHQGAAWLTVALALATFVLSAIFRKSTENDPRLPQLQRLAWIWSLENMLLALAVYHRLHIYISFNGMTRMRMVGMFGTSAVVIGFAFVVWKIARRHDFAWLVQRHLWTLAVIVYRYAITPVDSIVHTYNVRRILAGDLAPSVQICYHPIDAEGVLVLHPLTNISNPVIRDGIRAILAEHAVAAQTAVDRSREHWTAYQMSETLLHNQLERLRPSWVEFEDSAKSKRAIRKFREYSYRWY